MLGMVRFAIYKYDCQNSTTPRNTPQGRTILATTLVLPEWTDDGGMLALASSLAVRDDGSPIFIEMAFCRFLCPGAIVLLLARIRGWLACSRQVSLLNAGTCKAKGYLQRMDFFSHCGITLPEDFARRPASKRFVTVQRIRRSEQSKIDEIAVGVADCIFPEMSDLYEPDQTGLYDLVSYSVSELALNVVQHSNSDGFLHAQVYPNAGLVRIAIADYGIGIAKSFEASASPHWHEGMDDLAAIHKSLEPRVSSKTHLSSGWGQPVNAGVGLTLLNGLAKVTKGDFCVFSNRGYHRMGQNDIILDAEAGLRGTVCAITFSQQNLKNFASSLEEAKRNAGLMGDNKFTELFK